MHVSYVEISKVIKELEKEYEKMYKDTEDPHRHRVGFYSILTLRKVESRIREYIKKK